MATLGDTLKAAREQKGETPSEVAAATYIKVQHIEAMERNDFSRMAAAAYARGFIKLYANYLGLDPAPFISEYMELHAPKESRPRIMEPAKRPETDEEEERASMLEPWIKLLKALPWRRVLVLCVGMLLVLIVLSTIGRCIQEPRVSADVPQSKRPRSTELAIIQEPPEPYLVDSADARPEAP